MIGGTPISLIGLPYQFGRRADVHGYQMARGPELLLAQDALPAAVARWTGDVTVTWLDDLDDQVHAPGDIPTLPPGDQMTRQLRQNNGLASAVREAVEHDRFPVVSAGGCNSSLGVVAGLSDPGLGMFWFDAHADADTPDTSVHGMFEGMPVTTIAGHCWPRYREQIDGFRVIPESRIVQIGLHDNGFAGGKTQEGIGTLVDPPAVADRGFEQAFLDALDVMCNETDRVYVHIDTDVIDPAHMRGNLHTAPGGPSPDQIRWAVERIASRLTVKAVNFTSWDTAVDDRAPGVLVPLVSDVARVASEQSKVGVLVRDRLDAV